MPIFGHLRNNPSRLIVALGVSALVFADLVLLWALDIFELTELKTLDHAFTGINRSDPVFSGGLEHKRRRENEVPVRSRLDQNLEFEADRLGADVCSRVGYDPNGARRYLLTLQSLGEMRWIPCWSPPILTNQERLDAMDESLLEVVQAPEG